MHSLFRISPLGWVMLVISSAGVLAVMSTSVISTDSAYYDALLRIPYTVFDFGPVGNELFWLGLLVVAVSAAYMTVGFLPQWLRGIFFHPIYRSLVHRVRDELVRTRDTANTLADTSVEHTGSRTRPRTSPSRDKMQIQQRRIYEMPRIVIMRR